jgi:tetratricopeptide (TPR) repeat protein
VTRAATGRAKEAEELFRRVLGLPGADHVEARFNLALLLASQGRTAEAIPLFEQVLASRANFVSAWIHLGHATARLDRLDRAAECYRRALEIDPVQTEAYLGLGKVLRRQGKRAEAIRILTHGTTAAKRPAPVAEALAALAAPASPAPPG